jgi:hypothetical protein
MSTYLISDHVPPRFQEAFLSLLSGKWKEFGNGWVGIDELDPCTIGLTFVSITPVRRVLSFSVIRNAINHHYSAHRLLILLSAAA